MSFSWTHHSTKFWVRKEENAKPGELVNRYVTGYAIDARTFHGQHRESAAERTD